MTPIQLQLRAKHFEGTSYLNVCNCAISKAAMEFFNVQLVSEEVDELHIVGKIYTHPRYEATHFLADKKLASKSSHETVIRTIELIPQ